MNFPALESLDRLLGCQLVLSRASASHGDQQPGGEAPLEKLHHWDKVFKGPVRFQRKGCKGCKWCKLTCSCLHWETMVDTDGRSQWMHSWPVPKWDRYTEKPILDHRREYYFLPFQRQVSCPWTRSQAQRPSPTEPQKLRCIDQNLYKNQNENQFNKMKGREISRYKHLFCLWIQNYHLQGRVLHHSASKTEAKRGQPRHWIQEVAAGEGKDGKRKCDWLCKATFQQFDSLHVNSGSDLTRDISQVSMRLQL